MDIISYKCIVALRALVNLHAGLTDLKKKSDLYLLLSVMFLISSKPRNVFILVNDP